MDSRAVGYLEDFALPGSPDRFSKYRACRKDGDCPARAIMYGYIERLVLDPARHKHIESLIAMYRSADHQEVG